MKKNMEISTISLKFVVYFSKRWVKGCSSNFGSQSHSKYEIRWFKSITHDVWPSRVTPLARFTWDQIKKTAACSYPAASAISVDKDDIYMSTYITGKQKLNIVPFLCFSSFLLQLHGGEVFKKTNSACLCVCICYCIMKGFMKVK